MRKERDANREERNGGNEKYKERKESEEGEK